MTRFSGNWLKLLAIAGLLAAVSSLVPPEDAKPAGKLGPQPEIDPRRRKDSEKTAPLIRMPETDPQAAVQRAVESSGTDQVAIAWANHSLSEAIRWASGLPDISERNRALEAVANEVVRTEPMEALRLAVELPAGESTDELIRRAAMEWALQDVNSAVEWAREIEDETLRTRVLGAVATVWGDSDPASAALLAAHELPAGRVQADAAVAIAQRWAQQQPEQAAAWVDQFPPGPVKLAAIENVALIWSRTDEANAKRWAEQSRP